MATPTTIPANSITVTVRKGKAIAVGGITLVPLGDDQFRLTMPDGVSYRIASAEKPVVQSPQRPAETPATDE